MPATLEQQSVISNVSENKLVCALPGSGKTYTTISLADRITQSSETRVLMVTFTNSAMKEMQHRISKKLSPRQASRVEVKTFAKIMLQQFKDLDKSRQVILGGQLTNYYHRVAKKLNINFKDLPEYEAAAELIGHSLDTSDFSSKHKAFYAEVQKMLRTFKRVDLNTVAREVVTALNNKTLSPLPFTNYIVDEFQDTDAQQYQWLLAQKAPKRWFCVVADDDQSIYAWRGAKGYKNMVKFQADFEAEGYLLSKCFRCAPLILGLAQRLIEFNEERIAKDMQSMKDVMGKIVTLITPIDHVSPFTLKLNDQELLNGETDIPKFMKDAPIDTYRHIVDSIENDYKGLAILCRTNKHLDCMEYCLTERGIPAVRIGGRSIFDNEHAIGLSNLLIGFDYPKNKQMLVEGLAWIGLEDNVLEYLNHQKASDSLFDVASQQSSNSAIKSLAKLRHHCVNSQPNAKDIISALLTIIEEYFTSYKDELFIYRMAAACTIMGILNRREGHFGERIKALRGMLVSSDRKKDHRNDEKVILCTMTGAKGLEWKRTLLMMLNRQVIPVQPEDGMDESHIAEERRLLYVAMTRAEESLTLHFNERNPSIFMDDLGLI